MKNEASVPHFGSYTYNSHYTRRYTRIITLSVSIWDPGLFWIHGIHCVSPLRRKAFPITCVLVTKRPLLPFPRHNPRVTGDLFESRYYRPRDCEAYLVRRRIFPPRRKRRGNTLEFREESFVSWRLKRNLALRCISWCWWRFCEWFWYLLGGHFITQGIVHSLY